MMEPSAEFDRLAENYQGLLRHPVRDGFVRTNEFYHRRKWMLIAEFLSRSGIATSRLAWLDVGCGKGELLGYGRSHFGHVAGCDPSREMICQAQGIEVHLQEAPASLPFPDNSFDFVTAVCVYHHVEEALRLPLTHDIRRVLRPRGFFCMIEHNPFNPITRLIVSQCPVDAGARLLSARAARSYVTDARLDYLESQYFLYLPERWFDKAGSLERKLKNFPAGGQYAVFGRKRCATGPMTELES
jgi:SAM-dependent methyltransferase